jgi:hypothetical protein
VARGGARLFFARRDLSNRRRRVSPSNRRLCGDLVRAVVLNVKGYSSISKTAKILEKRRPKNIIYKFYAHLYSPFLQK